MGKRYTAAAIDEDYGTLLAMVEDGDAEYLGERYRSDGVREIAVETGRIRRNPGKLGGTASTISMNRRYYTNVTESYGYSWQECWWREAIQNAMDAKARNITLTIEADTSQDSVDAGLAYKISCEDDGSGMDMRTVMSKYLIVGATTKEDKQLGQQKGEDSGGFGVAKMLLLLPWMRWELHTQDNLVYGDGGDFEGNKEPRNPGPNLTKPWEGMTGGWVTTHEVPYRNGTKLTVWMPEDKHIKQYQAKKVIERSYVPNVAFTIYDHTVEEKGDQITHPKAVEELGEYVEGFPGADLYMQDLKYGTSKMYVRDRHGLFMFDITIPDVPKQLVLQLNVNAVGVLMDNRNGFANKEVKNAVSRFVKELAADVTSRLKKAAGVIRQKFYGAGSFDAAEGDRMPLDAQRKQQENDEQWKRGVADVEEEVGDMQPDEEEGRLTPEQEKAIMDALKKRREAAEAAREAAEDDPEPLPKTVPTEDLAALMLQVTDLRGANDVEAAIKMMAWEPDFLLASEVEGPKKCRAKADKWSGERCPTPLHCKDGRCEILEKFQPASMNKDIRTLIRFWAEMCRAVLVQMHSDLPFGVGFIFSPQEAVWVDDKMQYTWTAAQYEHHPLGTNPGSYRDEHWLLLNPYREGDLSKGDLLTLKGKQGFKDMQAIYYKAVHECTHMTTGLTTHDEVWSGTVERNFTEYSDLLYDLKKFRRFVYAAEDEKQKQLTAAKKAARAERQATLYPTGPTVMDHDAVADWLMLQYGWTEGTAVGFDYVTDVVSDADWILSERRQDDHDFMRNWRNDLIAALDRRLSIQW